MDFRINNLNSSKEIRKNLRTNATPEEDLLWQKLQNNQLGYKFRRQHSIDKYVVDFYCPKKKLVIEVDGLQHVENREYDKDRTFIFSHYGIKVLRFWNNEVNKDLHNVLEKIKKFLNSPLLF